MSDDPYYSQHKVRALTCPHCKSVLRFLVNERKHSVYSCSCGRWFRETLADRPLEAKWTYEPLERYSK